jgi:hypothetical protein
VEHIALQFVGLQPFANKPCLESFAFVLVSLSALLAMAASSGDLKVWYCLRGDTDEITVPGACNISGLRKAIYNESPNRLRGIDPGQLRIYLSKEAHDNKEALTYRSCPPCRMLLYPSSVSSIDA